MTPSLKQEAFGGECVLDIHATLNGWGLSLVWRDPDGLELKGVFLREFPTLSLAARAAAGDALKATKVELQQSAVALVERMIATTDLAEAAQ